MEWWKAGWWAGHQACYLVSLRVETKGRSWDDERGDLWVRRSEVLKVDSWDVCLVLLKVAHWERRMVPSWAWWTAAS